jgi:uncharacterized protein (TIGR02466 family)
MKVVSPFGSPIAIATVPDFESINAALVPLLLGEAATDAGVARSNVGGWHSRPDLARREHPELVRLFDFVKSVVAQLTADRAKVPGVRVPAQHDVALEAWAMVMGQGHYTEVHDHAIAHWSGTYYVDVGDPSAGDRSGALALLDPRGSTGGDEAVDLFPSQFVLRPASGLLVVFPGFLRHHVHPYRGERPRISIAMNARLVRRHSGDRRDQ